MYQRNRAKGRMAFQEQEAAIDSVPDSLWKLSV